MVLRDWDRHFHELPPESKEEFACAPLGSALELLGLILLPFTPVQAHGTSLESLLIDRERRIRLSPALHQCKKGVKCYHIRIASMKMTLRGPGLSGLSICGSEMGDADPTPKRQGLKC